MAALCAQAQQLQRLHVKSFTLTSDTVRPKLEVPFNVTLTIRLADNVAQLQNVYLPTFIGPEELGDVREQSTGKSRTIYRETLRLVAHARGPLTIGSAYLEAIDARDGKPKRFLSNDLQLYVDGDPAASVAALRAALWAAVITLLALVAILAFVRLRKRPVTSIEVVPEQPPEPIVHAPSEFETALAQLRARRDRETVLRLRRVLWHIAGAEPGETLAAVLRRPQAMDAQLRQRLIAVERAAFVEERRLNGAIDEVLAQHGESGITV